MSVVCVVYHSSSEGVCSISIIALLVYSPSSHGGFLYLMSALWHSPGPLSVPTNQW